MTRVLALAAMAVLFTGGSASAGETVSTAATADAHPPGAAVAGAPSATPVALNAVNDHPDDGRGVRMTACGPEGVDSAGVTETRPHGEISVGVGTHGYREVGGSVCQPLPGGGFVAISGGHEQVNYGH